MSYSHRRLCCIADLVSSRQIRPPIYSIKQSRLRKRQVARFAAMYFVLLIVFVGMIAGPIAYNNSQKNVSFLSDISNIGGFILVQPNHQDNNNTSNDTTLSTDTTSSGTPTATLS